MELQAGSAYAIAVAQVINSSSTEARRAPHNPMNFVAALQQQLGEIRTILTSDPGYERDLRHSNLRAAKPGRCMSRPLHSPTIRPVRTIRIQASAFGKRTGLPPGSDQLVRDLISRLGFNRRTLELQPRDQSPLASLCESSPKCCVENSN